MAVAASLLALFLLSCEVVVAVQHAMGGFLAPGNKRGVQQNAR